MRTEGPSHTKRGCSFKGFSHVGISTTSIPQASWRPKGCDIVQRRGARQETHTVKCFHVPSPEPSCCHCVICLSPPHLGDGQEDSPPLRTRKAVSDREASTVGCPLTASVGLQPQTEKEWPRPAPDRACPPSQGPRLKKPGVGGATTQQAALSSHPHTAWAGRKWWSCHSLVL